MFEKKTMELGLERDLNLHVITLDEAPLEVKIYIHV